VRIIRTDPLTFPLGEFNCSREATFFFVGIAFADVISDADKGKVALHEQICLVENRGLSIYLGETFFIYWFTDLTLKKIRSVGCYILISQDLILRNLNAIFSPQFYISRIMER
jgi:hypothetical protein